MSFHRLSWTRLLAMALGLALPLVAAASEPIRIGLLSIRSGPLAAPGKQLEQGFEFFLKERGNTLAGRQVEVIVVDTGGQPASAKTKTQELVERRKVDLVVGPLASTEALAIEDYIRQAGVPLVLPSALAEDMTQRKPNPWVVRATSTAAQMTHALGEYAAKTLGYKRVATIATDFAFGHEAVAGFQRVFEENGGKVVRKLWVPLNASDFGAHLARLRDVDAVMASFSGSSAQTFLRQYGEFGLKDKTPLLVTHSTVDESLLPGMGDDAVGVISTAHYSAAFDDPDNRRYVEAFTREYGVDPGFYSTGAYVAGMMIKAALQATGGRLDDKAAFLAALRAVKLAHSPRGALALDAYGNPVGNVLIRRTERKDGRIQNTVVKTYADVSQFWTYDPQRFLADPVYSRDFPPALHLEK